MERRNSLHRLEEKKINQYLPPPRLFLPEGAFTFCLLRSGQFSTIPDQPLVVLPSPQKPLPSPIAKQKAFGSSKYLPPVIKLRELWQGSVQTLSILPTNSPPSYSSYSLIYFYLKPWRIFFIMFWRRCLPLVPCIYRFGIFP